MADEKPKVDRAKLDAKRAEGEIYPQNSLLFSAIKDLQDEVKKLEDRISDLEAK